ncbi:MAG: hypothetical protein V3S48_03045 [Candidatus Neomarinimicrobiota bacterium]
MIKFRLSCLMILSSLLFANSEIWSDGTARLLPQGRLEMGFFQPLRYGFSGTMEISTYKLSTFLMPNLNLKIARNNRLGWRVATRHGLVYPTPMLRWLQSPLGMELGEPDKFALISPEFHIPQMISISNEILFTRKIANEMELTLKGGFSLSLGDKLVRRASIDLPLIFPRMSVYFNRALFRIGADISKSLKRRWSYLIDYDLFLLPGGHEDFAFEHKTLLKWTKNETFQLQLGYKLTAGRYPFGTQAHLLPLVDLVWAR